MSDERYVNPELIMREITRNGSSQYEGPSPNMRRIVTAIANEINRVLSYAIDTADVGLIERASVLLAEIVDARSKPDVGIGSETASTIQSGRGHTMDSELTARYNQMNLAMIEMRNQNLGMMSVVEDLRRQVGDLRQELTLRPQRSYSVGESGISKRVNVTSVRVIDSMTDEERKSYVERLQELLKTDG